MKKPSPGISKTISFLLAVMVPLALLLTSIRIVLTETWVSLEYHMPGFPADSYGMTMEERLEYGPLALTFLLNDQDISYLADQTFADGSPLYNDRELSHMEDVKDLTQVVLKVWLGLLAGLALIGLWAWRAAWLDYFKAMVSNGGKVTLYALAGLLLFAAISFQAFFTAFHGLFFEGDTWLFLYSDTLIRLFPERFWIDVVFLIGILTIGGALFLWRCFRK